MRGRQLCKNLLLILLVLALGAPPLEGLAGAGEAAAGAAAAPTPAERLTAAGPRAPMDSAGVLFQSAPDAHVLAQAAWLTETVDAAGNVGAYTGLALDANGQPHISYCDVSNGDLKYARYVGSGGNCYSDRWDCETVDSVGSVGWDTSLALDEFNVPHISYRDLANTDLKYAYYVGAGGNCGPGGNTWACEVVDNDGSTGYYTSLKLDTASRPHISYHNVTNGDLKYAHYTGTAWVLESVDTAGTVGYYTSLALDTAGYPHISYYHLSGGDLKYAYRDASGWHLQTIDGATTDVGRWTSIALAPLSGAPAISYVDYSYGNLKYAFPVDEGLGNCGPGGDTWQCDVVTFVGSEGGYTSLALDGNGQPHIGYHYGPEYDLQYAYYDGSAWQVETVDTVGNRGRYTSLALSPDFRSHISYGDWTYYDLRYAAGCRLVQTATITGPTKLLVGEEKSYSAAYFPPASTRPITVTWSNGSSGPSAVYSWDEPGAYTVIVSVTNPCGVLVTGTLPVDVCQPVQGAAVAGPTFLLTGEEGLYTATAAPPNASPPVTITWSNGTLGETSVYSWTEPGPQTVTVSATNRCTAPPATGTLPVDVCQPVTATTVNGPEDLIVNQVGHYTASHAPADANEPVTFAWSNGSTEPETDYSWPEPGLYTITVTATNPCDRVVTDTLVVDVCQPVEGAAVEGPPFLLTAEEGLYTATHTPEDADKPVTFAWDNGTVSNTAVYSWTERGQYYVTVSATNRCTAQPVTDTLAVEVCQPVTAATVNGPPQLIVNQVGHYTASHFPVDANEPVTFTWSDGTVGPDAYFSWDTVGLYTITVTATNPCGVEVTGTLAVSVTLCKPLTGVGIAGPDVLLVEEVGTYTATWSPPYASTPVTVTWDNGTVGPTAAYSWEDPNLYTITVTATNPCGDVVSGTLAVSVTLCKPLTGAGISGPEVLLVGDVGTYTATWSPPSASTPVTVTWDNGTVGLTAAYSWSTTGWHTITLTATNPCGAVVEGSLPVSVTLCQPLTGIALSGPEVLPIGVPGDYGAAPLPANASPPITVTWDNGTVGSTATYSWAETGWQTIAATATNPCTGAPVHGSMDVNVCRPVSAVTVSGPPTRTVGMPGDYSAAYVPSNATPPVTFTWSNGTSGPQATYIWTVAGHQVVTATASSICGQVHGSTVVAVSGQIYLPLVSKYWNRCFLGQARGFTEFEPNDSWEQARDNGPLCSGPSYYGHPDDAYDIYRIFSEPGTIVVTVRNYTADLPQLVLYNDNYELVVRDTGPGPDLQITWEITEGGGYYLMLYALGGYTTAEWYTLTATFPEQ